MVDVQITTDCPVKTYSVFDATIDFIGGISHREVIIQ